MIKNVFTILFLILTNFVFAQFPSFKFHQIGVFGDRMGQTALVDLDEDGDLDWIFGNRGKMWWYEYQDADYWILHDLGEGAKTDVGGCAADFNHDGKMDFMVGSGWYENTGSPKSSPFRFHFTHSISCHNNVIADVNNDGIMDVISNSNDTLNPYLAWYKISEESSEKWQEIIISEGIHGGVDPKGASDLDNDGDIDIVRGDCWFENLSGDGLKWERHQVFIPKGGSRTGIYGLALKTWISDLDNDGDQDIVQAECDISDTRIFYWENQDNGKTFIYHFVSADSTKQDFHSLAVADFDNDGDENIFSGGGPMSQETHKWYIWENLSKDGQSWKEHIIPRRLSLL